MTSGYRSQKDRRLVEDYLRDLGLVPVRMAEIGYDIPEERQCYLFIALGKTPEGTDEYSVQVVSAYDDGIIGSVPLDYLTSESEAVRSFQKEVVSQRNLLMLINGSYRQRHGTGVPEGYEDVLGGILRDFQVGDYRIVEVDGRPAVEFSVYQCDAEYALEDYAAEYDRDRMVYRVYLDDPHGRMARSKKRKDGSRAGHEPEKRRSDGSARIVHSGRSGRARTLDSRRRARTTFPADYTDEQFARWAADPGRYDIEGIDTPGDDPPQAPKKKTAKGGKMATNARKPKAQPRNRQGRFVSREMAERPRKANGQFAKKKGGRR